MNFISAIVLRVSDPIFVMKNEKKPIKYKRFGNGCRSYQSNCSRTPIFTKAHLGKNTGVVQPVIKKVKFMSFLIKIQFLTY